MWLYWTECDCIELNVIVMNWMEFNTINDDDDDNNNNNNNKSV